MKDYLAAIINRIREGAFYLGLSYQCPVDSAVEVEAIADADDRARARDEFFAAYGLTSQVWANVPKRFPNYQSMTASGVRALAYLCQLRSTKESQDLFIKEFHDLINDPNVHNLARIRVNEIKEIKRAALKPRAERNDKEDWRYRELLDTMKQIEIMAAEHKPYDLIYSEACRSLNTIGDSTPTERKTGAK